MMEDTLMTVDARGMKHPEPLKKLRDLMRDNCRKEIDVKLLVDTSQCSTTVDAFAKMSKCKTSIQKADGHYIVRISGEMCSCA